MESEMREQLFADGISEITLVGSTLRIDLVSLSPTERDANNNPRQVLCQRIVMPVEGFASTFNLLEQVMQRLLNDGLVMDQAAVPSSSNGMEPTTVRQRVSPNFP